MRFHLLGCFLNAANHGFDQTAERRAPLEFLSAYNRTKKVTVTVSEGFVFENLRKPKKIRTEDSGLAYAYSVTQEGNKLIVESTVKVADATYPAAYLPAFKQIFDVIVQTEGQVVTAVKK